MEPKQVINMAAKFRLDGSLKQFKHLMVYREEWEDWDELKDEGKSHLK